jgi:tetratricopeptide (TPR) repeat protein
MMLDSGFVHAKIWYLEQADLYGEEAARIDSVRTALTSMYPRMSPYDQATTDRELAFLDGRLEDAYTAARRMVAIAPRSSEAMIMLAQTSMATRRFQEAISVLHRLGRTPTWLRPASQRRSWDLQAHLLIRDYDGGLAEWRQAVTQDSDDYLTCISGIGLLAASGREASADSLIGSCARIPNAPRTRADAWVVAARHFRYGGHAQAADRAFEKVLSELTREARTDSARRPLLALTYLELEDWRRADSIFRSLGTLNARQRVNRAIVAAHLGDSATALETLEWLKGGDQRRDGADMDRAFIQVALGQHNQALTSLQLAMEAGRAPAWNGWYVRSELNPLRGDRRFEELIRPRK